jgi:hypothetical protein
MPDKVLVQKKIFFGPHFGLKVNTVPHPTSLQFYPGSKHRKSGKSQRGTLLPISAVTAVHVKRKTSGRSCDQAATLTVKNPYSKMYMYG